MCCQWMMLALYRQPRITTPISTSQKKTVAAVAGHEKLAQFVVSRQGALVAAYNTGDSAVFKIADVSRGSAEWWRIVVDHEVSRSRFPFPVPPPVVFTLYVNIVYRIVLQSFNSLIMADLRSRCRHYI